MKRILNLSIKNHLSLTFSVIVLLGLGGCTPTPKLSLKTVESVNLDRYMGKWIEIARYENRFEKGCVGASAEYKRTDSFVSVTNRCFDASGIQTGEAIGRAYPVEGSNNSKLEVSFFRPFYGDYWVLMLSDDYRYSVVGDPDRKYLWILAREGILSEKDKKTILTTLPSLGYDPQKLYWTKI